MCVKRSTVEMFILIIFVSFIACVYVLFRGESTSASVSTQTVEEQYEVQEAYSYTLTDIRFDGTYVSGDWKDSNNEEQYITTRLPSSGNGMIRDGVSITLRSYEVPKDGVLDGCYYWSN